MKRLSIGVMVAVAAFLLGTVAYGAWQGSGPGGGQQVDVNALRQFQKETLPLRDELQDKSLELRNEYTKENPDQAKVTKLRNDIEGLGAKIQTAAEKNGLPEGRYGTGMGYGMMGPGGSGHGDWMMGRTYGNGGYGRGYCPMW